MSMGRLTKGPHPLLIELLYEAKFADDQTHLLRHLLELDAAHVVMVSRQGLLSQRSAAALLVTNRALVTRLERGEETFERSTRHRGLYAVYERHYIDVLGSEIGGSAHVARSRNDINATLTRMRLRRALGGFLEHGVDLVAALTEQAEAHLETLMPGFTHQQPSQPSTFGHYLSGVTAELLRGLHWLSGADVAIDCLPLGAAAGFGTSFPIDPQQVAGFLGFSRVFANSLDAVASRDYIVQVLAALSVVGTTLSRIATDLQTWSAPAYGFLSWPDELVSTSSIMPQKRNPFVLENIRGLAVRPFGALFEALAGLKNTPFTNSVEVSAEATHSVWEALDATQASVRLLSLLVRSLKTDHSEMERVLGSSGTTASAIADMLVRESGVSFRTAHEIVSREVEGLSGATGPETVGRRLQEAGLTLGHRIAIDPASLAAAMDPRKVMRSSGYGGGPAPEATRAHNAALRRECLLLRAELTRRTQAQADARQRLQLEIASICEGHST